MSRHSIDLPSCVDASAIRKSRMLSSELYFEIPPTKASVIYSSAYDISFMGIEKLHPFDSSKWRRVCGYLIADRVLKRSCIVEPREASKDDLLAVHSETYLKTLTSSMTVASIIEVPPVALLPNFLVQLKVLFPFRKQTGGTILAAKLAKDRGWAINVGGGFHHCCSEKGGGFCVYADISLCIHFAFVRLNVSKVLIVDLDAHQGNGHETDFSTDSKTYYLLTMILIPFLIAFFLSRTSIYSGHDYEARRYIDQDIKVESGTSTEEYLSKLDEALEILGRSYDPDLIIYNAGTDVLDGDPLGLLKVSPEGVVRRDEMVFSFARSRNVPIVMLTSGGYMKSSARVIADSIKNLSVKSLIDLDI